MEFSVDADFVEKLIEYASNELTADSTFREKVAELLASRGKEPKLVDTVVSTALDAAAYSIRRNMSGKTYANPFAILRDLENALANARIHALSSVVGAPGGEVDPILNELKERLSRQLSELTEVESFARKVSAVDDVGALLVRAATEGKSFQFALAEATRQVGIRMQLERDMLEDDQHVRDAVAKGRIYRFQAERLRNTLRRISEGERSDALKRDVVDILVRR